MNIGQYCESRRSIETGYESASTLCNVHVRRRVTRVTMATIGTHRTEQRQRVFLLEKRYVMKVTDFAIRRSPMQPAMSNFYPKKTRCYENCRSDFEQDFMSYSTLSLRYCKLLL